MWPFAGAKVPPSAERYTQRMSAACVMNGAEGILKGARKMSHVRLRRAAACQ